jgi:hypothetical protein
VISLEDFDEADMPGRIVDRETGEVLWTWDQELLRFYPWAQESFLIEKDGPVTNIRLASNRGLVASYEEGEYA